MILLASTPGYEEKEEEEIGPPKDIFSSSFYDFEHKIVKNGEYQFILLHSEKHQKKKREAQFDTVKNIPQNF